MSSKPGNKSWTFWSRLIAVAVTLGLIVFVYCRIDIPTLQSSLHHLSWFWVIIGFLIYGVSLGFGGLRSHFALRLTRAASHFLASCRMYLVSHFLFLVLFGAAGGDIAKSAVYSRWYRFGIPEVIAAAPFDRLLGVCGSILLSIGAIALAIATGSFSKVENMAIEVTGVWAIAMLGLIVVILGALCFLRPKGHGFFSRTITSLRLGAIRLFSTPGLGLAGLGFALLTQLTASLVFAIDLYAVTDQPLPWLQLGWIFPAITILSCMPFTVAGIGSRELIAIGLLGMYGVPAADCAAASLLMLLDICAWAAIAAIIFWREEIRVGRLADVLPPVAISAIVPARDEAETITQTIQRLRAIPEVKEIIVADGSSRDATRQVAEQAGARVVNGASGRGPQMRLGAEHATGDVLLFIHADSWLPPHAGRAILDCLRDSTVVAGGFWKRFHNSPVTLRGSRFKCAIRLLLGRRIAGDQAIFVRRSVLEKVGGFPGIPLMEEFELCRRLRRVGRLALADATIVTSARRFERLGVLRTYWRMWWVTTLYRLGRPPAELAHIWEKGASK